MSLNHKMAEKHESDLAERLVARRVRGSGSQWKEKMDVRHSRFDQRFAFGVEAKSTLGDSISITRKRIAKAEEQAGHERPMFALRFYGNERLTQVDHDWIAMRLDDHEEMVDVMEQGERLKAFVKQAAAGLWDDVLLDHTDSVRLVEASMKECSNGTFVDDNGSKHIFCACGWRRYVTLGRTIREVDEALLVHLDV